MRNSLRLYILKQQYAPGILGVWVNPFFLARKGLRAAVSCVAGKLKGRLLDVGCGRKPYQDLFQVSEYVGLEVDTPGNREEKSADYFYDGKKFPFSNGAFDSALCNQVLEHVFEPDGFLSEISRILKPGGLLLISVPFVWDEHEKPYDYARYSSFGLASLLSKNGFEVLEQKKVGDDCRVLFQLANAYLYKVLWTRYSILNLLICSICMAPLNLLGWIMGNLLPSNPDLYLDQIVLARKVTHE